MDKIFGEYDKRHILKASGLSNIHTINKSEYKTLSDIFIKSCEKYKDKQSLGSREILKQKENNGKIKYKMGKYNWLSYEDLFNKSKHFGCGLRNTCKLKQKNKIAIYANTKKEWFIIANGALMQNYTIVTCYSNLGIDALIFSLNQTKSRVIIIDEEQKNIISKIKDKCKYLRNVIIITNNNKEPNIIDQNSIGFKCHTYNDIIQNGEFSNIISLPNSNDIAFIMYTSGSTGNPKGIKITHKNLVVSIYGIQERVLINSRDIYLAYLPLAHILELSAEYICIFNGAKIGYGLPQTLTDKSVNVMKNTKGDATKLNPTIIAFVPLILNKLKDSIVNKIDKSPSYVQKLYQNIYNKKKKHIEKYNNLIDYNGGNGILNIIRKCLGNNLRSILSGGAPLSNSTREFFNICFDINILQGYGLTETCGSGCISNYDHYNHNTVGPPLINNYIKLINWKEAGYYIKDNVGEICIGGENITPGYYKNNEETLKNYFIMNNILWFKTGDIGKIHKNGTIEIIDRKKDIVKMSTGEYLSYAKVENIIKELKYIDNCMLFANEKYNKHPLCIISLDNYDNINKDDLKKNIHNICKDKLLKKFEIPDKFIFSDIIWTSDNNLLTSSFKLKRLNILKYYKI